MGHFIITDNNPNDDVGGGGCLCSPDKVTDCKGPFAVFHVTDMDNPVSPHQVIGARCIKEIAAAVEGETLDASQGVPYAPPVPQADVEATAEETPEPATVLASELELEL